MATLPEVWLRGPVPDVAAPLQPVVHSLLQVREELERTVAGLTPAQLHARPCGAASVAYHVRHLLGSLDRLLTYAEGAPLSAAQLQALAAEQAAGDADADALLALVRDGIEQALERVRRTPVERLGDERRVGRAGLPSTVLGLLFHAAEHGTRHAGQAVTTAKIVRGLGA
jgi:uncharacterized damage-inducible protein DinB